MQKNLVIVESPAKAKTIEKFLGKDFKVLSSYGHIRDLKKKDFSIDIEHNYTPIYEIPADKKKLVETLKEEAAKAETVWLASDEDREGEAIAWHLYEVLKLKPGKYETNRISRNYEKCDTERYRTSKKHRSGSRRCTTSTKSSRPNRRV